MYSSICEYATTTMGIKLSNHHTTQNIQSHTIVETLIYLIQEIKVFVQLFLIMSSCKRIFNKFCLKIKILNRRSDWERKSNATSVTLPYHRM